MIIAAEVKRDEQGYWTHPALVRSGCETSAELSYWLRTHKLQCFVMTMRDEAPEAFAAGFTDEAPDARGWFQMLGVDLEKLDAEQQKKLRQSEEHRRLIEEGILREDEEISPRAARERWYRQKTLDALKFRRQRGAERKRANRLARYSRERQIHEMSLHILKTMPADEAYWCTTERLQQLAIQNLYQLELALAPPS
ncbi:replication initiation domain protein [Klebsiella pneumoniae UHKPC179]|nr:replication initiation domain protein [Klebsiella pneumoniae]EPA92301.1 replication initiation domain protein [Klebsiella pneumoniae UHKPC57]EPO87380.1 replication initiation domain protein [Klebsiella pneumoniae UHKPC179]